MRNMRTHVGVISSYSYYNLGVPDFGGRIRVPVLYAEGSRIEMPRNP